MKTRFTWLGIVATIIAGVGLFFAGCNGDVNSVVLYHGQVVYINTTTPFADLTVKVTDGQNTHCQTQTDAGGLFSLKVRVDEIDGSYYLLAGDSTCVPKKVALGGFGQAEVDLGVIEVEGPALPTVVTTPIQSVTADAATLGGEVQADGRLAITARGVCYGTNQQPTIDGMHTTDGIGKGVFTSNLRDLEHNTIYYARAYATNRMGTAYGEQVKFTTELGVPIVITDSVVRITAHTAKCKGHVESDGGYAVSKRGTCWSKRPDPTVDDDCTDDGSGIGEFTSTMKDLQESTTYYIRTYATNSTSTVYGEQIIITTLDGLAVVKTDSITSITATGFTAYGTVVSDCDIPVTARGICYSTTQYPTIDDKHTTASKGLGNYRSIITGLEYATTYYVRAYATNATATVYGEQKEIKTLTGLPSVTTDSVTNIGSVKATCGGNVTDDGSLSVTARGVCYGTEPQPTIEDAHTTDGKGKGKFTSNLKNLQDKTTYYVRAYATTAAGTTYGEQRTFKTENGIPVVLITQLSDTTANSVTCKGKVTGDGGVTVTERGFCYSLTQYPTNTDAHVVIGNGIGEFTGSLSGLNVNTTYYVRAYAVNSLGVGYSEQKVFTTKNGLATITTTAPTSTATTISVGGNITDNGGYAVTERGVCYSASSTEPTITDAKVLGGKGNGAFNVSITGLTANTTYHIRAYALNENGITYGETKSIQTKDGNATVALGEIDNITALTASSSVIVSDAGGATLQSCGICWSTNPNPTITDNKTIAGGKQLNTMYSCNLSNLSANTVYYVRAYATTDVTTTYSTSKTFTTITGLPVVFTGTTSSTASSFTCAGEVTNDAGYAVSERGICYSKTNSEPTVLDAKSTSGSGKGTYSVTISELQPSISYYVRAYATNTNGTAYGEVVSVTTKSGTAIVTTGVISNIKALSATGSVTVSNVDGSTLQSCGICWSTTHNTTTANSKAMGGNQLNTKYTCNISSLVPNTTYYVRAYAITEQTTTYGSEVSFTTTVGLPTIALNSIQVLTKSLTVNASISSDGGYSVTKRGVCWSATNGNPTIADSHSESGTGTGSYSIAISNLQANSTYYVRAYAQNETGIVYSDVQTKKTGTGLQGVHFDTDPISNIKGGSATCKVIVDYIYTDVPITGEGVCWSSTTTTPTINDSKTNEGQSTTSFTSTLTNLTPLTIYYVRAYVTTSYGTVYSSNYETFTTASGLPTVTTNEIITSDVTNTSFTCGGEVTDIGDAQVTERGICWNTTGTPTISDSHSSSGSGLGSFTHTVTSVSTTSQTYYIRAYATNKYGTSYGDVVVQDKNNPYHLSVYEINGVNYMIYPQDLGEMNWNNANSTCENLSAYGFNDWRLPTSNEASGLRSSSAAKNNFIRNGWYWTSTYCGSFEGYENYYIIQINSGYSEYTKCSKNVTLHNTRPIRIMVQ